MSQHELDAAVAQVTGESLRTVRRRGFSVVDPDQCDFDTEPDDLPVQIVDWDAVDRRRLAA